ncbi:MAG: glycosyltransferase, partial [Phycisphaerales bacterium]|nr:glycosyltransferase [Phycisphaerales bacterium]
MSNQSWLRYFHQPHPGYQYSATTSDRASSTKSPGLSGEAYAKVLARSKVFVSCTGKFNLPFIKISEVLASGAVLMCDRPCGADELGLIDDENYVSVDAVNFMGRLHDLLHDPARLNRIAKAGRQLAETKLALPHYAKRAAELLLSISKLPQNTIVLESTETVGSANMVGKARQVVRRKLESVGRRLLPDPPVVHSPALPIEGGTQLDWALVAEHQHILDCSRSPAKADMQLIQHLGLNAYWGKQPVVTQNPEVVSLRPLLLQDLARTLGARNLAEIGTARGMQSMFWARYLRENSGQPGRVYTCDIVRHDEPVFRTPLTGERHWTRRELWQGLPESNLIDLCMGTP